MTDSVALQTLVVGTSIFEMSVDHSDAPRSLSVEVRQDGLRVRGWEEPGWRTIGLGLAGETFYWWSARRLVVLGLQRVQFETETTEDLLYAFATQYGWLIVCETSARLVQEVGDSPKGVEFDDVVGSCHFDGVLLKVELTNGTQRSVEVTFDGLLGQ
jgi:hypothetical protein